MNGKVNILGVNIDKLTMESAISKINELLTKDEVSYIFTPNSEIIYLAKNDKEFREILNSSSLNTADGIGVVYAAKILKNPLQERVSGCDIITNLLPILNEQGKKLFLFGGKEGVAKKAAENISKDYPKIKIVGCENGYFDDDTEIINKINETNPDFVLVCLGAPAQEKWIYKNKDRLKCKVLIGAGGSIDILAGEASRGPEIFIKLNMEWFYRLLKNPKRIGRMMALPKFAFAVMKNKKSKENDNA